MSWSKVMRSFSARFWQFWKWALRIILWTPGSFNNQYFSRGTNWFYFQFQSKLLYSQIVMITAMQIPLHISVAILADASDKFSSSLRYMAIAFITWNVFILTASTLVKKFWPIYALKLQYILVFLSFASSFEEQNFGLYMHDIDFFYPQRFGLLFYLLMICTIFFQWSTLFTGLLLAFFGGNVIVSTIYSATNVSEVCASFNSNI